MGKDSQVSVQDLIKILSTLDPNLICYLQGGTNLELKEKGEKVIISFSK